MDNNIIYTIAENNSNMVDIDRLVNLYWALSTLLLHSIPGAVLEVGCCQGKTSVFLQIIIDYFDRTRQLHLFDSFEGLPEPGKNDFYLKKGDCKATIEDVHSEFSKWNLQLPHIHSGWFRETFQKYYFDKIAFAYIDCDFQDSIFDSLSYVYPRLSKNGIIIVDDYCDNGLNSKAWSALPGVKIACDQFVSDKPEKFSVLVGNTDLAFGMLRKM